MIYDINGLNNGLALDASQSDAIRVNCLQRVLTRMSFPCVHDYTATMVKTKKI
jgi:hypothetical protein